MSVASPDALASSPTTCDLAHCPLYPFSIKYFRDADSLTFWKGFFIYNMKTTVVFIALFFLASSAQAENNIVGKWKDKNDPFTYQYEFKESNDFIYTYTWNLLRGTQIYAEKTAKGVWEIGEWISTSGNNSTCNLTIYADTNLCCFYYKFIADNLILTNKDTSSNTPMCDNRVLIREK